MSGLGFAKKKRDWETTFTMWAQPPVKTQQEKCERAINAIKDAIKNSTALGNRTIDVFAQGSFRNRTSVRQDSDVDVGVLCTDFYFYEADDAEAHRIEAALAGSTYSYRQYKNEVEAALVARFGRSHVKRGNKAIDINENTYRVDADVVACFELHKYYRDAYGTLRIHKGVALLCDNDGKRVTNFPEQQFNNGRDKNTATGRRFRAQVRIVKTLRNEMDEIGIAAAKPIASYLIESLAWNWSTNEYLRHATYESRVIAFLEWVAASTQTILSCFTWMEVNNIKYLFGEHNKWTVQEVNTFAKTALAYLRNQ